MKFIPFLYAFALCFSQIHENKKFGYRLDLPDAMTPIESMTSDELFIAVDEASSAIALVISDDEVSADEFKEYLDFDMLATSMGEMQKAEEGTNTPAPFDLSDLRKALKLVEAFGIKISDLQIHRLCGKGTAEAPMRIGMQYHVDGKPHIVEAICIAKETNMSILLFISLQNDPQREAILQRIEKSFLGSLATS